ncbi:hypothetical protein ES319_A07G105500v1 [Gossypium barbadense]|uniref:Integral membrane bound transporter domain-containing protein n=2 Tax=Gossypium TaxID=3633 RepID=A0A2P5XKX1_GOSBA|nr:hypothetical protein ES319_A07G105500v1 [Gossypium barbadense]PPS03999.1 hypothetical protein GOBAR_AA16665 [Gossypium barbadense]TYH09640.1 hypothetical protein ES288_A07G112600v1 [Gossypium darwinii]
MPTAQQQSNRARALWLTCLASSFRTALACTIVGIITLYGPASVQSQVAFPAFSYVTVILVVTDATLGDTLHGCWLALYASVQSLGPAMLSLWLIRPTKLTSGTTALAVALGGMIVVLPEATHMVAKRIALGQIVIVYVIGFINGGQTEPIMHPVHVAASTAVGVLACVLALMFPYPRLACCESKKSCKQLAENSSERLKLFVKALCAQDKAAASGFISQAKLLNAAAHKLVQSIKRFQGSMKWEKLPFKFLRPYYMNSGENPQEMEMALRGMEIALESIPSFPGSLMVDDGELKDGLLRLEDHISCTIRQSKCLVPGDSSTVPEPNAEDVTKFFQSLQTMPQSHQDLPTFFFLFCMKLLHSKSLPEPRTKKPVLENGKSKQNGFSFKEVWSSCGLNSRRVKPALKFSLSLGCAVLFGLKYSKPNGFWSGLPVAISFAAAREATFKVANIKAQGTVLGTVYGVIGCFLFERFLPIRFLSLLPWFIFTSFLRQSKMYGQAGGISAVIGALLILGRKNFGPPSEFAIARIIETFIGLSCSIGVELLFQPKRASTLAKIELSKSLGTLHECIDNLSLQANHVESHKKLKFHVNQLGKFIGEAEVEPDFWFLPFHSACHGKLFGSLSKMSDLLLFGTHAIRFLQQESQKLETSWKETVNKLDGDLKLFKGSVGSLIKCLGNITSIPMLDKGLQKDGISYDIEMGKPPCPNFFRVSDSEEDEDELNKALSSFLQHSKEAVDMILGIEGEKEIKSQMVLSLSCMGYCIKVLIAETRMIEEGIRELVQWENPSTPVNLHEISCKIRAQYS